MMDDELGRYWHELVRVLQAMPLDALTSAADLLFACYRRNNTVFIIGNGGSAATAAHFACDLAKGTRVRGIPAFRVVALVDNVPLMTAWANDCGYDGIFAQQLAALVRPADAVVAISVSGNSLDILAAARMARRSGAVTLALTGQEGGQLSALADLTIYVPGSSMEQVEDAHLIIAHSLCVALRKRLGAEAVLQGVPSTLDDGTEKDDYDREHW